jgi:hypothetical protein
MEKAHGRPRPRRPNWLGLKERAAKAAAPPGPRKQYRSKNGTPEERALKKQLAALLAPPPRISKAARIREAIAVSPKKSLNQIARETDALPSQVWRERTQLRRAGSLCEAAGPSRGVWSVDEFGNQTREIS